jgi:hypothetical protein
VAKGRNAHVARLESSKSRTGHPGRRRPWSVPTPWGMSQVFTNPRPKVIAQTLEVKSEVFFYLIVFIDFSIFAWDGHGDYCRGAVAKS